MKEKVIIEREVWRWARLSGMCPLGGLGKANIPLTQVKKGWQELMRVNSKIFPLLELS